MDLLTHRASTEQFAMSAHNVITVPEFKLHPGCRTAFRWSTGNELILFQQPTQNVADNIKLYSKSVRCVISVDRARLNNINYFFQDPSARKTTVLKISEVVSTQKSKVNSRNNYGVATLYLTLLAADLRIPRRVRAPAGARAAGGAAEQEESARRALVAGTARGALAGQSSLPRPLARAGTRQYAG